MGDTASRPLIEELILATGNPRLKIMGVEALGIFASPDSLSVLVDTLKSKDPPPYLRDEVTLAMARILDIETAFYKLLVRFLKDETQVSTLAIDDAEAQAEHFAESFGGWNHLKKAAKRSLQQSSKHGFFHSLFGRKHREQDAAASALSHAAALAEGLQGAVTAYLQDNNGRYLSEWILALPDGLPTHMATVIFSEAVLDDDLLQQSRLKLLIVHWCGQCLRVWGEQLHAHAAPDEKK
jgi:hypothetical protein